jgi:hypothetical protein
MSIPRLCRSDVLRALRHIDRNGVRHRRESTRYALVHNGRQYPPKYAISLAAAQTTGRELEPQAFGGGVETNSVLRGLGFRIITIDPRAADRNPQGTQSSPVIARVVVRAARLSTERAEERLLEVLTDRWPAGVTVKFLITPGGFVRTTFPSRWSGGVGWVSRPADLKVLAAHAATALSKVVTPEVLKGAKGKADVLTVGIDLENGNGHDAELVATYEVATGRVLWTGKSYPVAAQQHSLVQVVDLRSHFQVVAGQSTLVLGCHDLNMFSARGWANQQPGGARHMRCAEVGRLARTFKPTVVLQHPHATDSPNVWRTAWAGLRKCLPTVTTWASGIAYTNRNGKPRAPLAAVLEGTQGGAPCLDFY